MDVFFHPEYLLLLLEQMDRALEDHTGQFLLLANATSYLDNVLCAFYNTRLNTACRAPSSENGPRKDFATFLEWTLAKHGSPFTVIAEEDLASATPDPVPSPPSPCCMERIPEPLMESQSPP
ncbi:Plasmalemma vesicle-associated protein [Labeo rohita]|uniref:Plasmalemma vesicle-associated protein n=1 Tax=Labeo rohita TaxID=84645 RepID=A0ABQ8MHL3_LABRO|nr:Plasmalemma vesicle-associated protein [Labeo rohita]